MVDLEYYGVSRYHLDAHPNRELDAVRCFFRRLEFDVSVETSTRVHARYDKERARDLGDLCAKAESLFRLAPYLMDLDWTLGDLRVAPDARETAAEAWAAAFERWGAIPLDRIISKDRLGVVVDVEASAAGERERLWDGSPPYRDRDPSPGPFFDDLRARWRIGRRGGGVRRDAPARPDLMGAPCSVRCAPRWRAAGSSRPAGSDVRLRSCSLASRRQAFARLLASGGGAIAAPARLARLVAT
jgi:hypothetical protein